MNLNDLHTFAVVAKMGTVTKAAEFLGIPKSTVSRRVRRLEESLGTELFHRSAKRIVLTQDGKSFFERIDSHFEELMTAEKILRDNKEEPTGILRITTTEGYAQNPVVMKCLATYLRKYPKVEIDLVLTSRIAHLVDEQIDVGLRLHTDSLPGDTSTMSRRLHSISSAIYASPEYLQQYGAINSIQDLTEHNIVVFTGVSFPNRTWLWSGEPYAEALLFGQTKMSVNSTAALLHCALSGIGLCILDINNAQSFVEKGELVRVLPDLEQQVAKASIVWIASRHLSHKVRSFIDHAVQQLGA